MLRHGCVGGASGRRDVACQHLVCSTISTSSTTSCRGARITTRAAVVAKVSAAEASTDAVTATRQTYIQESINFTGAELAARLPSMQAALRAQRGAAADAAAAAAAASTSGRNSPGAAAAAATRTPPAPRPAPRTPAGPPVPPVTRSGPHPALAAISAAAPVPAAPYSNGNRPYNGASTVAAASTSTLQVADVITTTYSNGVAELDLPSESYDDDSSSSSISQPSSSSSSSSPQQSAQLPSASNMQALSTSEKMQALQQVQHASRQALTRIPNNNPYYANAPKTIDIRMYDQLVVAHNKLSGKLSDANAHAAVLEEKINSNNEDMIAAFELMKQIAMEFGTTSRLAQATAAAVQFGVDPQDALDKISKLQERLSTLEQAVLEQRAEFGKRVVRKVPVEWIGVASEVKVMGDFDGWTRGHELSAEDVASDSVYSRFEGTLLLRPGKYRVKFMVDDEWRLAADWPTEMDEEGNEVCLLTVT